MDDLPSAFRGLLISRVGGFRRAGRVVQNGSWVPEESGMEDR